MLFGGSESGGNRSPIPGVGLLNVRGMVGLVGDIRRFRSGGYFSSRLRGHPGEYSCGERRLGRVWSVSAGSMVAATGSRASVRILSLGNFKLTVPVRYLVLTRSDQNWNLIPASIVRGEVALKDRLKNRDVMTPLGVPRWVMLKALFRFAKIFT